MTTGRVLLRLPTGLQAALAAEAQRQNVSVNTLMVALLAGGIGFKIEET